jgi:hypothetical protein
VTEPAVTSAEATVAATAGEPGETAATVTWAAGKAAAAMRPEPAPGPESASGPEPASRRPTDDWGQR